MVARAQDQIEPNKILAETNEQAGEKTRDASFGIVVAVISASLLWAGLIAILIEFLY